MDADEISKWVEPNATAGPTLMQRVLATPYAVISGSPGSGKSRLMREARRELGANWAMPRQPMVPLTPTWRSIALPVVSIAYWEGVWRILLLASIASFVNSRNATYLVGGGYSFAQLRAMVTDGGDDLTAFHFALCSISR